MEENVATVGVSCVSTFALRKVHDNGTILHEAIVSIARGIFNNVSFGVIELYVSYKTLFYRKENRVSDFCVSCEQTCCLNIYGMY